LRACLSQVKGKETHLDDRSDELDEETGDRQKRRKEVVEEVDEKTLDMRSILILYGERERRMSGTSLVKADEKEKGPT
jgi:hypothetical protein